MENAKNQPTTIATIKKKLKELMPKWANENSPNQYKAIDTGRFQNSQHNTYTLEFLNEEFLRQYYNDFKPNVANLTEEDKYKLNIYRNNPLIFNGNNFDTAYITAQQIPQIDVWQDYQVVRSNKDFRYNNQIKAWESHLYKRHYDRSNEGLAHSNPERASLSQGTRGYDMSDIIARSQAFRKRFKNPKNPYSFNNI